MSCSRMRRRWQAAGLVLVISAGAAPAAGAAHDPDLARKARQEVARDHGLDASRLTVVEEAEARLRETGRDLVDFKVATEDGRIYGVSFDARSRNRADAAKARAAEVRALGDRFGKKSEALARRMARAGAREPVRAVLWAPAGDLSRLGRGPDGVDAVRDAVAPAQNALLDAVRAKGGTAAVIDAAPAIQADLPASDLQDLEARADIVAMDLGESNATEMLDDSATSNRFPWAWPTATGAGVKVTTHERYGVDNVNTWLHNATHPVAYYKPSTINTGSGHATNTAGVYASTHPWRRGGSYGIATVLSANFQSYTPANESAGATWALSQGTSVINMSWGGCTSGAQNFESRWVDYLQKTFSARIVVSAGNIPNCSGSTYVASPGLAYNVLTTGSYYDNETGGRADDVFSRFSQWRNPKDPTTGRRYEKPELVAHGGQTDDVGNCFGVETTAVGGGVGTTTCGTSFSAPDTSALAALVMQKTGAVSNPEAVKAIVIAGATHNIKDALGFRSCATSPVSGDCQDGAGAIDAQQTLANVVTRGNYRQRYDQASTFPAGATRDVTASFVKGRPVRVVLTWDASSTCSSLGTSSASCTTSRLNADLDLSVLNPDGTVAASSASLQNSTEVIDFVPSVTGTYRIRTRSFRFDSGTTTYTGLAWNANTTSSITPLTGATTLTPGTTLTGQTTNRGRSFFDRYTVPAGATDTSCNTFLSRETGLEKPYVVRLSSPGQLAVSISSVTSAGTGVGTDLDVVLVRSGTAATVNRNVLACGQSSLTSPPLAAGTYYVFVDGYAGSVANYTIRAGLRGT